MPSYLYNAMDTPLNLNPGTLPCVSGGLNDLFQPLTFKQVVKSNVNFQVVETPTIIQTLGVWQQLTSQQLMMKSEGERAWTWYSVHTLPGVILSPDDVIVFNSKQYRVMSKDDYAQYGFVCYHVILDFTGAGP